MSRSKEHDRRKRVARSLGTPDLKVKDNKRIEHAEAAHSRDVNAQVKAGTYTPTSRQPGLRFAPMPQLMHFSPTSMPTYDEMQAGAPVPF